MWVLYIKLFVTYHPPTCCSPLSSLSSTFLLLIVVTILFSTSSILITMEVAVENKDVNRMSVSAVAACMSPLLLRPVELENEFDMGSDGSAQLMQAATPANHAQVDIITLLEEYDNIFGEGDMHSYLYSDSKSGSGSKELSDDDAYKDEDYEDGDYSFNGSRDYGHASSSSVDGGDSCQHGDKVQLFEA